MEIAYSLTVALFLTIALMPIAARLSPRLGLIDRPNEARKQHVKEIPRCGGIAMAIGIATPLIFYSLYISKQNDAVLNSLFIGSAVIVAFGLLDDSLNLNYRWKFAGQIIATLIVMIGGISIQKIPLLGLEETSPILSHAISFLFILGVTNAVNLTDGLDGLAGGSSLLTLSAIAMVGFLSENTLVSMVSVTAIGGVLGFLRFNTHPAQVFMGDTGSQLLGFLTACLSLLVSQSASTPVSPILPLLLLGLPILDTLTVMTIRIRERRSPFSPDRNHLHHQIISLGFRHNEAVAIIYLLQIFLLSLAFLLRFAEDWILLLTYFSFCITLTYALQISKKKNWRFHTNRPQDGHTDRRNIFLRKLNWFYHGSAYIIQTMIVVALVFPIIFTGTQAFLVKGLTGTTILVLLVLLFRRHSQWLVRAVVYPSSTFCVYLLSSNPLFIDKSALINGFFITLAATLALAIRMTRREQFSLDTQDLLVLLIVLVAPLLPFEILSNYAVGEMALRLAVLMYGCEFVLGRMQGYSVVPIGGIATFSLIYGLFPI